MGLIYLAINRANGKKYVGKTIYSLESRIKSHMWDVRLGFTYYFHRAIRKYGKDVFIWSILWDSDDEVELFEAEVVFIKVHHSKAPGGYNMTDGGEGTSGFTHVWSEDRKQRVRERMQGNQLFLGCTHTTEAHKRVSYAAQRHIQTEVTRKKRSDSLKGHVVTAVTRKKLRASTLGKKHSPETIEKIKAVTKLRAARKQNLLQRNDLPCQIQQ